MNATQNCAGDLSCYLQLTTAHGITIDFFLEKIMMKFCILLFLLASCGGRNTGSNIDAPGDDKTAKDKLLNTGAALLQDKAPLEQFSTYLDGFHFYNGNLLAQMEAHHYVHQLNEDVYQAVIIDGNDAAAKLMGVEYIITSRLFATLPGEEKLLWHSHHYEVKSGTLIAPGIPEAAETELVKKLVSTYGKTIHAWHTDQQRSLPIGAPMIMMGFTKEGQLDQRLLRDRDERFKVDTRTIKERRAKIPDSPVDSMANAWERGIMRQFIIANKADSALHQH